MPLNLSFTHIMVVAFVALLVLGPERLPGVARTAGNLYREWKRISGGLEAEVRSALSEFTEPISDLVHGPTDSPTQDSPPENSPPGNGPAAGGPAGSSGPAGAPSSGTGPGNGSVTVPPLAPVFASLGPSTGLLSVGPSFEPALPELAPAPEPGTFVPFSPRSGGHG